MFFETTFHRVYIYNKKWERPTKLFFNDVEVSNIKLYCISSFLHSVIAIRFVHLPLSLFSICSVSELPHAQYFEFSICKRYYRRASGCWVLLFFFFCWMNLLRIQNSIFWSADNKHGFHWELKRWRTREFGICDRNVIQIDVRISPNLSQSIPKNL